MSNSLGDDAFCKNIKTTTITDINNSTGTTGQLLSSTPNGIDWVTVSSVPTSITGSFASPVVSTITNTVPFIPGIYKYILFVQGPLTTGPIVQSFQVTGVPQDILATYTPVSSASFIVSGGNSNIGQDPDFTADMINRNNTIFPNSYLNLFMTSTVAPQFTLGVSILKMVIDLQLD
jgi:hypothetical protein